MAEGELFELVISAKSGNQDDFEKIVKEFKSYITHLANKNFMVGGDKQDIFQHGMIGIYRGIGTYDIDKMNDKKPSCFIKMCIKREIFTSIKNSLRKKHSYINNSMRLEFECENEGGDTFTLKEMIPSDINIEDKVIVNDKLNEIDCMIKNASEMQYKVYQLWKDGYMRSEIASITKLNEKQVDNAITRMKRLVKKSVKYSA